uniref:Cell division cycle protein 23 homolog n=1 Tax=Phallusia mammillata TaxID=59560 RepID=A0A6F9D9D7_9ASCI|nr:cell division cycle protein 23 homolog [Phallusia mammillata]
MSKIITEKFDKHHIKFEILSAIKNCQAYGLTTTTKWLAELSAALDCTPVKPPTEYITSYYGSAENLSHEESTENFKHMDQYTLAKSYFDIGEYDRASHVVKDDKSGPSYFLHVYSRYLSAVKKHQLDHIYSHNTVDRALGKNDHLRMLRAELAQRYKNSTMDSFALYLYGIILKKTSEMSTSLHRNEAVSILSQSVRKYPMNWGAWHELSSLVSDQQSLSAMDLPQHWMKDFFLAQTHVDLINAEEALNIYDSLKKCGFPESCHIKTQEAIAQHNRRVFDDAIVLLEEVREQDPYRLDDMDILSNMYYVKGRRADLAHLAHHCTQVDKYRVETCCIVGNYYSIRSDHEKAVLYFQRALKLNPNYLSAWTLMGHEYTEVKNTSAAIQAYRNAVDLNRRDYRAWYGLGQTYELLKMYSYALYYFKQSHRLRPFDSRMLMAVGETYEVLERPEEAKMCYRKAIAVGDIEGMANTKLAKLYRSEESNEWAAYYYERFAQQSEERGVVEGTSFHTETYSFLARHYLQTSVYDSATYYAHKCCEHPAVREEGKAILRQISQLRGIGEANEDSELDLTNQPTPGTHLQRIRSAHDSSVGAMDTDSPAGGSVGPIKLSFSPGHAESDVSNIM